MSFDQWGAALSLARQIYETIKLLATDTQKLNGIFASSDIKRFHDVYFEDINEKLKLSVNYYLSDFHRMKEQLNNSNDYNPAVIIAGELAQKDEEMWYIKHTVEVRSGVWLKHLPEGSIERGYVWAVLNVFYRDADSYINTADVIRRADDLARQQSDEGLDTPSTRISDKIKSGEIIKKEEIIQIIDEEYSSLRKRFKLASRIYEEIKRDM